MKNEIFCCVMCKSKLSIEDIGLYKCINENCLTSRFEVLNSKPVFIDFDNSILDKTTFFDQQGKSTVNRIRMGLLLQIRQFFRKKNRITQKNIDKILEDLSLIKNPKILIIGGGEIGNGIESVYNKYGEDVISFDIYSSPNIKFFADAHDIPILNDCIDLVIIQAVLEHVIDPKRVVDEIWRVLNNSGVVYAETPFMQQVHEGPFDFTRFSETGHRLLFNKFELKNSGYVLGAGTSLLWSLSYFFAGLFRNRIIGKIVTKLFFWLVYFDDLIPNSFNIDGACGVFFHGKKSREITSNEQLISQYKGAQK